MTEAGIVISGLVKKYRQGKVPALDGITLSVQPGEIFGLIGPNGAGKTTFMGCLLGLLFPDAGEIRIDGRLPEDLAVRKQAGYLPERLNFDRWMSGRQFVTYHHGLAGQPRSHRSRQVEQLLERVQLPASSWDQRLSKYSRGMLQRLGLAQALVGNPGYLFLDEPSSGIDPVGVLLFRRLLKELKDEGKTIVLNSHQLDQVERICDRVAFIRAGKVETIENLREANEGERILIVRWRSNGHQPPSSEHLRLVAGRAGVRLLDLEAFSARFSVADDEEAERLLGMFFLCGIPIVEASTEGRLERFFFENAQGESA